jgi:hypothetical protein
MSSHGEEVRYLFSESDAVKINNNRKRYLITINTSLTN